MAVKANKGGKGLRFDVDGVFIFAGLTPNTSCLVGSGIKLDDTGHIMTDLKLSTNIPGIFASGDVRSGATKQVASAVGEGATVAHSIREYLQNQ
ncbi:NAD(P)/FAD-dependent oxidoreductase [Candidatus Saccharibacteria bacterium]|nr:NAD(P)/FAD-dependent oxidoreductase [Candidatus Saccharibacteria bacterium]